MKKLILIGVAILALATPVMAQEPTKEYTFKITTVEIGLLGKALGQMPYGEVAPLMLKLQQQINVQNSPPVEEKKEEKK